MRRVSSRPRLFSWDQFDATADPEAVSFGQNSCSSPTRNRTAPIRTEDLSNNDDSSEYLEYMSCHSISTAREVSRSTSMLSLKNFTAHGLDDDDSDDDDEGCGDGVSFSPTPSAPQLSPLIDEPPPLSITVSSSSGKKRSVDGTYVGMHKSVSFSNLVQIHPSSASKISPSSYATSSSISLPSIRMQLITLQEDMQLECLTFLNLKELQKMGTTCRYFQSLLRSSAGARNGIWWSIMKDMFPHVPLDATMSIISSNDERSEHTTKAMVLSPANVQFTCCSDVGAMHNLKKNIHYGALLSLASSASETPTTIDDYYFTIPESVRQLSERNRRILTGFLSMPDLGAFRRYDLQMPDRTKRTVAQYLGRIGVGDRSIRADHPFPRPRVYHSNIDVSQSLVGMLRREGREVDGALTLFDRLRTCRRHCHSVGAVYQAIHTTMKQSAFVSPYLSKMNQDRVEIDLTPRMLAYFEVSILPRDKTQESNDDPLQSMRLDEGMERSRPGNGRDEVVNPCVAVGLSIRGFSDKSRMPGWDIYSYGYHGDDGGIFHSKGNMIRVYGPTYKEGDTVGCGVNYQNGGIFYTLNGDFLGYAWMNEKNVLEGKVDLFPTVGVDTNNPLAFNFGSRPFVFDFQDFVQQNGSIADK